MLTHPMTFLIAAIFAAFLGFGSSSGAVAGIAKFACTFLLALSILSSVLKERYLRD